MKVKKRCSCEIVGIIWLFWVFIKAIFWMLQTDADFDLWLRLILLQSVFLLSSKICVRLLVYHDISNDYQLSLPTNYHLVFFRSI